MQVIQDMDGKTIITVGIKEENETKILFEGIVINAEIEAQMNVREMKIEALSSTYIMDMVTNGSSLASTIKKPYEINGFTYISKVHQIRKIKYFK